MPPTGESFGDRAAVSRPERDAALRRLTAKLGKGDLKRVRVAWADLHGVTRCKTLFGQAALDAAHRGVPFVGTPLLKDTSDRTSLNVFSAEATEGLPQLANAANVVVLPDPETFVELPWSPGTAWVLGAAYHHDGTPCLFDPRHVLAAQIGRLQAAGHRLRVGLEVEFHVYRLSTGSLHLDPEQAGWPGPAPSVEMLHGGYRLLSEESTDAAHFVLELVESTAKGLALPLRSLEVEFGPSQFEAVFDVLDAQQAADAMVLFRTAVRQVMARHGYFATFVCRPPFPSIMSSGWHLHQSLVRADGGNAFAPSAMSQGESCRDLSALGERWLAGLMKHALGSCVLATPTVNGYGRYQPNALAPTRVRWGRDDRSALFRIVGTDAATRIENRMGEPSANPYLYIASQIIGGLDGLDDPRSLATLQASIGDAPLPESLGQALAAFQSDDALRMQLGPPLCTVIDAAKTSEWSRFSAASDPAEFDRREYFARL